MVSNHDDDSAETYARPPIHPPPCRWPGPGGGPRGRARAAGPGSEGFSLPSGSESESRSEPEAEAYQCSHSAEFAGDS